MKLFNLITGDQMNFIIPYNADKGDPINLDHIVSFERVQYFPKYVIRFHSADKRSYDWDYVNTFNGFKQDYNRLISRIDPEDY